MCIMMPLISTEKNRSRALSTGTSHHVPPTLVDMSGFLAEHFDSCLQILPIKGVKSVKRTEQFLYF
uniref:Uncharacterized protein n=1 Tax=Anguilla anguilla TaxID=7936 RepID=A0A0E9U5E4_ANGAN